MEPPLIAILVAVPLIAIFFIFVLLPRLRRHDKDLHRGARLGKRRSAGD